MKKVIFSLAIAALSYNSFGTIIVWGSQQKGGGTSTTNNPDGSTTTTTTINCASSDFVCTAYDCVVAPNGQPVLGSPIELDLYQNNQVVQTYQGTLQGYQNWLDQQGNNDFVFVIWEQQGQ